MKKTNSYEKNRQMLLIMLCWLAYFTSYFGRYSYNANIIPIESAFGIGHAQSGLVVTFYFFSYGAGQIIHSFLCKKYPFRYVIFGAMAITAIINLAIAFGLPFGMMKYAFVLNGVAQASLWPSIVTILSRNLDEKNLKRSTLVLSTPSTLGTLSIYGISAVCAMHGGYKTVFLISGSILAVGSLIWLFAYGLLANDSYYNHTDEKNSAVDITEKPKKSSYIPMILVLATFCLLVNFLKDGLQTWVPSIMKESFGLGDSLSLFLTLALPVFGMIGALTSIFLHTFIPNFILQVGLHFGISALLFLSVIFLTKTPLYVLVLACFSIVMFLCHGSNNLITSVAPLGLRSHLNAGLLAGLLNGCGYVGSTLSSYGLGAIADATGWSGVSITLLFAAIVPVIIATIFLTMQFFKKHSKTPQKTTLPS